MSEFRALQFSGIPSISPLGMSTWKEHAQRVGWSNWTWNSVFLVEHTSGQVGLKDVQSTLLHARQYLLERPPGAFCLILSEEARPPDGPARDLFEQFFRDHPRIDVGVWIRTTGVWGSAIRSVATGVFKIRLRSVRSTIFANRQECVRWLAERAGVEAEATQRFVEAVLKPKTESLQPGNTST